MPRKGIVSRRAQATDPVYDSDIVEKFICSMMWEGKKSTAQRVFYGAMDQVAKKSNEDASRGWRELSGSGGSEPVPAAVAGHSLAFAVFARACRQDHGRPARG